MTRATTDDIRPGFTGNMMPAGSRLWSIGPLLMATATVFRIPVPAKLGAIKVRAARSIVTVAIGTGATVVTVKKQHLAESSVAITGGSLTLAESSAVAHEDTCTIIDDATSRIPGGDFLVLDSDGGSDAGEATFYLEIEPVQ